MPIASAALAMVLAVYMPPQAPTPGSAFRSMHSHGRALNALLPHAVDDVEALGRENVSGVTMPSPYSLWHFGQRSSSAPCMKSVSIRANRAP